MKKYQPIELLEGRPYTDDVPDYHFICDIDTPSEKRLLLNIGSVYCNQAKCLNCGEIVRSKNQRDFRSCSCGKLSVDGGSWYLRRIGTPGTHEEMSINFADSVDTTEK